MDGGLAEEEGWLNLVDRVLEAIRDEGGEMLVDELSAKGSTCESEAMSAVEFCLRTGIVIQRGR